MKTVKQTTLVLIAVLLIVPAAFAKLAEPDHVFYGVATWFGDPLATGTEIKLVLDSQGYTGGTYRMGDEDDLNGLYALRVPMDSIDPQTEGRARPGEPASIYINGNLVAQVLIGGYGQAQRLDIDPANLLGDVPALSILSVSANEGNSGVVSMDFTISLNQSTDQDVSVNWSTLDGTATGGAACNNLVDYLSDSGSVTIPAGQTSAMISVNACGDVVIEENENFVVVLSSPVNAIVQFDRADGNILNDDGQPQLTVSDLVVYEPQGGMISRGFNVQLSRAYTQDVTFNYATADDTAIAGLDYTSASGASVIPAGQTSINIPVNFSADIVAEGPEAMYLDVNNVVNAVVADGRGMGVILDSDTEPQTEFDNDLSQNDGIDGLSSPVDVLAGPDSDVVYVPTLVSQTIVVMNLNQTGQLSLRTTLDETTLGFENALFGGIRQLVMTPDQQYIYAAASSDDGIDIFARSASTGNLTFVDKVKEGDSNNAQTVTGLNGAWALAVSPDGKNLYVAAADASAITVFDIATGTGALSYRESHTSNLNGGSVVQMQSPKGIAVSADGNNVYVSSDFGNALHVFNRNTSTGALSFVETHKEGVAGVAGLSGALTVKASADGKHVYVLGNSTDAVSIFNRNANGTLTFMDAPNRPDGDFLGLDGPRDFVISEDDQHIYAVGFNDSSLVTLMRNNTSTAPEFGQLNFQDIRFDNSNGINNMAGPTAVTITADNKWILVASGIDNAVSVYRNPGAFPLFVDGFE
ncbi:MAG: beta-propeller fold lactonase family protein [bacterium]